MFIVRAAGDPRRDDRCGGGSPLVIFGISAFFFPQPTRRGGESGDRRCSGPLVRVRAFSRCRRHSCRCRRQANNVGEPCGNRQWVFRSRVARCPQEGGGGQLCCGVLICVPTNGEGFRRYPTRCVEDVCERRCGERGSRAQRGHVRGWRQGRDVIFRELLFRRVVGSWWDD